MNNTVFIQTGGWPLNAERLEEIEITFSIFNAFGSMAGNLSIISGCNIVGTNVSDGFVYIDGELYDFKSGAFDATSTVIIVEEKVNRPFQDATNRTVYIKRYATFGTSETSWLWSDFKRLDPIVTMMEKIAALEKKSAVFQAGGGMVLWNKPAADIPSGWQEVVNWRGRMPVGFDSTQVEFNAIGKTGGAKNKTMSIQEMPKHSHDLPTHESDGGNNNRWVQGGDYEKPGTRSGQISETGGSQPFSILNPYRVVLFIEYIG